MVFHNNVNSKTLKSIEEIATAVAIVHNLVRTGRGEVITNLTVPFAEVQLLFSKSVELRHLAFSLWIEWGRSETALLETSGSTPATISREASWIGVFSSS